MGRKPKNQKTEVVFKDLRIAFDIRGSLRSAFIEDCNDRLEKPAVVAREILHQHYRAKGKI
jgi:hypothetical protein